MRPCATVGENFEILASTGCFISPVHCLGGYISSIRANMKEKFKRVVDLSMANRFHMVSTNFKIVKFHYLAACVADKLRVLS